MESEKEKQRQRWREPRPAALYFLTVCLLFLIAGGWVGGLNFIFDPSGKSMQMQDSLPNLLVPDYLLPGIFLLVMYGVLPVPLLVALWTRPGPRADWQQTLTRRFHEHWAWLLVLGLGLVLLGWLALEVVLLRSMAPIQWIMVIFNFLFLAVIMLPSLRRYYRAGQS